MDASNPYHNSVVEQGERIVPILLDAMRSHPESLGWTSGALDEIGSPTAFPALLEEYSARLVPQLAIRVVACTGEAEISLLFRHFEADQSALRVMLRSVYGPHWPQVAGLSRDELRRDFVKRLPTLRAQCRSWAWPRPG